MMAKINLDRGLFNPSFCSWKLEVKIIALWWSKSIKFGSVWANFSINFGCNLGNRYRYFWGQFKKSKVLAILFQIIQALHFAMSCQKILLTIWASGIWQMHGRKKLFHSKKIQAMQFCHCIIIALLVSKCYSQEFNLQKVFCWGFEAGGDWAPGNLLMTEMGQIKKAAWRSTRSKMTDKLSIEMSCHENILAIWASAWMNAQTEKKYSEKNASYHNYILSKILGQELKLIASRAGTPTCFCCDGVGAWNCVFLKWICLHWYSVSEVAVVWAEKGKGNIFSAS